MAANTWSSTGNTDANTGANWSLTTVPATGDNMTLDGTSVINCTLSGNIATADGVDGLSVSPLYTGTLNFNGYDIDSDGAVAIGAIIAAAAGDILYCGGDFSKSDAAVIDADLQIQMNGTGSLTCNSIAGGNLVINTAATATASGAQLWDSWTLTTGTYAAGSNAHTIVGDIVRTAGTCTTTGAWTQTGTGNLKWAVVTDGQYPASLAANGTGTITTGSYFAIKALSGTGIITDGGGTGYLYIYNPPDDFWTFAAPGTISCAIVQRSGAGAVTTGATTGIILQGKNYSVTRGTSITLDGPLNLKGAAGTAGDLLLTSGLGIVGFDAGSQNITAGNITIGNGTYAVTLDLGTGNHAVTGTISRDAGTPSLNFGSSYISLMLGTLNGSNITATADAAIINPNARVVGGTVSNVVYESGKTLDCSGGYTADGGGNTTGQFWFGSQTERRHPAAIRERQWGFSAGTRR